VAAGAPHHYIACIDLAGREVLVVGAGSVALEKIHGLLECGASVTVVAPDVCASVELLAAEQRVTLLRRRYQSNDLEGRLLVIAATSDTEVNTAVHGDAEARSMLCNVVDVPALCSFILPALHRQSPITVAVSTGGASPALAQRLRDEIARIVGPEHAALAEQLREVRPWAKDRFPTYQQRRAFFQELVEERLG
jgi:precorrin-2 dehydrogenase/sirohydrochlorin ferrochelatase